NYDMISGGRVTLGIAPGWFLPVEASGLWFNRHEHLFNATTDGSVLLARPVQLITAPTLFGGGTESAFLAGFPPSSPGSVAIQSNLDLWAIDVNLFLNLLDSDVFQGDFVFGYKHLEMNETF